MQQTITLFATTNSAAYVPLILSLISSTLYVSPRPFRRNRVACAADGFAAEVGGNELSGVNHGIQINAGVDA